MQAIKFSSAFVFAASLFLTGCASKGYGNYSNASIFASTSMADSTVSHLVSLYPPGNTEFSLKQPATDPFGTVLVQRLRSRGYAVKEFISNKKPLTAVSAAPGTSLGYVVNTVAPNLYQVTAYVGNATLSRGFVTATDGKAYPAGPWTRED